MPVKIFFCYAHEDETFLNQLQRHLSPLRRQGFIDVWYDRDISAGTEWEQTIKEELNTAQIVLLLVSPDFIDSDYCYSVEMKLALERHIAGEARVIPIILRPVHWEDAPFSKLQVLPTDGEPVVNWLNSDDAFLKITVEIRNVVIKLLASDKTTEGDDLFQEKNYDEALKVYEQAIQLAPKYVTAYIGKGNALSALNRYAEALDIYEQAIQLDPNLASANTGKNKIFEQLEKSIEVQQELKTQLLNAQQELKTQQLKAHQELEDYRKKTKQLERQLLNAEQQLEALNVNEQQLETLQSRTQQFEALRSRTQQLERQLLNAEQKLATFHDNEQELAALYRRTQQLETKFLDVNQQFEAEQFKAKQGEIQLRQARIEIEAQRARIYLLEDQNSKLQGQLEKENKQIVEPDIFTQTSAKYQQHTSAHLVSAYTTVAGKQREQNEDMPFMLISEDKDRGLFIVADGMGGYQAGEVASKLAVQKISEALKSLLVPVTEQPYIKLTPLLEQETIKLDSAQMAEQAAKQRKSRRLPETPVTKNIEDQLKAAIRRANKAILNYGEEQSSARGLGCTVTTALIQSDLAFIANIGNSRTYLYRESTLTPLTKDHSNAYRLVEAKQIEPNDIYSHPQRHSIYRSLGGGQQSVDPDVFYISLRSGDSLLLCSDGLWEMVLNQDLLKVLKENTDAQKICDTLIDFANTNGGEDNMTAVLVQVH